MDAVAAYMSRNKVDRAVQRRVRMWMYYTWEQQKSFDEAKILEFLPLKTRTDIAMRVHYPTLVKLKLFRNCEPGLLKDLVIKLRPVIYLPGDSICRKNDIGTEMFIIQSGQVHVMGGLDGTKVLCTLAEGSVFGEIALLGVGGMNKRTADVLSVGFSNLFVLQKEDLEEVLEDYPDAKRILNVRARKLMKENEERLRKEREQLAKEAGALSPPTDGIMFPLVEDRKAHPALLDTVMKALPEDSGASNLLRKGSRSTTMAAESSSLFRPGSVDYSRRSYRLSSSNQPRSMSLDQNAERSRFLEDDDDHTVSRDYCLDSYVTSDREEASLDLDPESAEEMEDVSVWCKKRKRFLRRKSSRGVSAGSQRSRYASDVSHPSSLSAFKEATHEMRADFDVDALSIHSFATFVGDDDELNEDEDEVFAELERRQRRISDGRRRSKTSQLEWRETQC